MPKQTQSCKKHVKMGTKSGLGQSVLPFTSQVPVVTVVSDPITDGKISHLFDIDRHGYFFVNSRLMYRTPDNVLHPATGVDEFGPFESAPVTKGWFGSNGKDVGNKQENYSHKGVVTDKKKQPHWHSKNSSTTPKKNTHVATQAPFRASQRPFTNFKTNRRPYTSDGLFDMSCDLGFGGQDGVDQLHGATFEV
jgi:hypothetical protein